eukprot:2606-Pelagococcus_subviridis.AAC.3
MPPHSGRADVAVVVVEDEHAVRRGRRRVAVVPAAVVAASPQRLRGSLRVLAHERAEKRLKL